MRCVIMFLLHYLFTFNKSRYDFIVVVHTYYKAFTLNALYFKCATNMRALDMANLNINIITNLYLNKTYIENIIVLNNVYAQ